MEKTPDTTSREIPFREAESGMMVGLWHTPLAGFEWRDDLRPAFVDGKIQLKDPPERSWWLVERGDIGKRSARLIRAGGTLVSVVGPPVPRPDDGLAVDGALEQGCMKMAHLPAISRGTLRE